MSDENNRRRPKNLEGLLKFCLSATQEEDAPRDAQPRQLSEEEKQWIQGAMQEALGNDPVKLMVEHIQLLSNMQFHQTQGDFESQQKCSLEEIAEFCEDIDLARDFHKIGGYALLPRLLEQTSSEIRWRAADLVATLVQNNPYCQKAALDLDLMRVLLDMVANDSVDLPRIKALYAVSCLSRECEEAQESLIKHDGLSTLVKAMQSNVQKLQIKSAFLISYLCSTSSKLKGMLTDTGIVEQLIGLLHAEHAPHHEHLTAALVNIINDNTQALQESTRSELRLRPLLEQRIKFLEGNEEYLEEKESCKRLLQICFTETRTA